MKKNKEKRPQPLPSIQSSFPVFMLNDPSNVRDLLNDQSNRMTDQSPGLLLNMSSTNNISINNDTENSVAPFFCSINSSSHKILKDEEAKNTNIFLTPVRTNQYQLSMNEKQPIEKYTITQAQDNSLNTNLYDPYSNQQQSYYPSVHTTKFFDFKKDTIKNPQIINYAPNEFKTKAKTISTLPDEETNHHESFESEDLQESSESSEVEIKKEENMQLKSKYSSRSNEKSTKSKIDTKSISIDPNKLGFLPRDFWIRSNLITLEQIKRDFFRARSSKSLRFEFKLWNALAITKRYPSLFKEIGVKWVAHVLIMVHRDVFGKLLNVSRPSAALFSSCGAFMTHGFIEVSLREAKQRLRMMSANNRALANPNYGIKGTFYQNQSGSNGYFYGPNIYSNTLILPIQSQAINYQQVPQVQQLPVISNSNPNLSSYNPSPYPYPNQNIQSDSSIRPIVNPMAMNPAPDIDFELPSEIDESIIRLFTHKTGEFTEDSHANEIIKCKWSNESRSQIKNFKI